MGTDTDREHAPGCRAPDIRHCGLSACTFQIFRLAARAPSLSITCVSPCHVLPSIGAFSERAEREALFASWRLVIGDDDVPSVSCSSFVTV